MEPERVIKSIDNKMGFIPEIMNMMGKMNPELFEHYKKCDVCCESQMRSALKLLEGKVGAGGGHGCMPGRRPK